MSKRYPSRQGRSKRLAPHLSYTASRTQPANRSSLRDGRVLQHLTQHFVLGYFHRVPPGRLLPAHISSRYVDLRGLGSTGPTSQRAERFAKLMLMGADPVVES